MKTTYHVLIWILACAACLCAQPAGGTIALHGTAFAGSGNEDLNANSSERNFFGQSKPLFRRTARGFALTGPGFFTITAEQSSETGFRTSAQTYPTLLQRSGDFSRTAGGNGSAILVYDPRSTVCDASALNCTRSVFANLHIPAARISPAGANLLALLPLPQLVNATSGNINYLSSPPFSSSYGLFGSHLDRALGANNNLFGAFEQQWWHDSIDRIAANDASLGWTSRFSPTLAATLKMHWIRYNLSMEPGSPGTIYQSKFLVSAALEKILRNHILRFGITGMATSDDSPAANQFPGVPSFSEAYTQANPLSAPDPASGDSIATTLLGHPEASTLAPSGPRYYSTRYASPFLRDDWRVSRRLSLNLGLRWDYQTPPLERYNRQVSGFDPLALYVIRYKIVAGAPTFASPQERYPYRPDRNNFAPRIGMAYQVSPKIVLRGGYGIVYAPATPDPGAGFDIAPTSPQTSSDGSHRFPITLFPASSSIPFRRALPANRAGQSLSFVSPNFQNPMSQQFNAGVELALPSNSTLRVSYAGSRTSDVGVTRQIDTVNQAQFLGLNTQLTRTTSNPVGPIRGSACLGASRITVQQSLLPYPQYCGIAENGVPVGRLWYNSLQAIYQKRLSHSLAALGGFTWGKSMGATDYSSDNYPSNLQRVLQSASQTLRLTAVVSYQLPVTRRFSPLLAGWTISGIANLQTGAPIEAPEHVWSTGINPIKSVGTFRDTTAQKWFNTCTITASRSRQNCIGPREQAAWTLQPTPFVAQTLSARWPNFQLARPPVFDVDLSKAFLIRERFQFLVAVRGVNIGNTPWFEQNELGGGINTNATSPAFGTLSPLQGNAARRFEIVGKLSW